MRTLIAVRGVWTCPRSETDNRPLAIAITVARAFIDRLSAEAHFEVFKEIFGIAVADTSQEVRFRHIHSSNLQEHVGIEVIGADEHKGQALGGCHSGLVEHRLTSGLLFTRFGLVSAVARTIPRWI